MNLYNTNQVSVFKYLCIHIYMYTHMYVGIVKHIIKFKKEAHSLREETWDGLEVRMGKGKVV